MYCFNFPGVMAAPPRSVEGQVVHRRLISKRLAFFDVAAESSAGMYRGSVACHGELALLVRSQVRVGDGVQVAISEGCEGVSLPSGDGDEGRGEKREVQPVGGGELCAFCLGSGCNQTAKATAFLITSKWDVNTNGHFQPIPPKVPLAKTRKRKVSDGPQSSTTTAETASGKTDRGANALGVCKYWVNTGGCPLGKECRFKHSVEGTEHHDNSEHSGKRKNDRGACLARHVEEKRRQRLEHAHGDGLDHAQKESRHRRAVLFVEWAVETFGLSWLKEGIVLDVAGGRGDVSWQFASVGVKCVVIDTRAETDPTKRSRRCAQGVAPHLRPSYCQEQFDESWIDKHSDEWGKVRLLVGMHPDQATDSIVSLGTSHHKAFAVVPCCVFANAFQHRKTHEGGPVETYEQLVEYLRRFRTNNLYPTKALNFVGRNLVVYQLPTSSVHEERAPPTAIAVHDGDTR